MKILNKYVHFLTIVLVFAACTAMIYAFSGMNLFEENAFNSYSLQARAWLNGRLDLGQDHPHLELAIYNGKYYVSFPPLPSVILLPFVLIFGVNTPDNLIAVAFALLSALYAYRLSYLFLQDRRQCVFFTLFLCVASNYLHVSVWGSVWYIAQNMAFAFTLMSLYYAVTEKDCDSLKSLLFLALAVGCRPFQAIYGILILVLIYDRYAISNKGGFFRRLVAWALPAIAVGCLYMLLNYLRFGSVFEFGHNYLPEFTESVNGQFSTQYVPDNLESIFTRLPYINDGGMLEFPKFDGVAFWLVSPIVIAYLIYYVLVMLSKREPECCSQKKTTLSLILLLILLHLMTFTMHKTMGGHHFGNRYTIDCLPALFLGLLAQKRLVRDSGYDGFFLPLLILGLCLNVMGSIEYFSKY